MSAKYFGSRRLIAFIEEIVIENVRNLYVFMVFMIILGSWNLDASAQNVNFPDENLAARFATIFLQMTYSISKSTRNEKLDTKRLNLDPITGNRQGDQSL